MRFRQSVVLFGMTLNSFSIGEQENKALEGSASVLADIPSCAVNCLMTALARSSCSPDDMQCICDNETTNNEAGQCILQSCSFPQALAAKNVMSKACNVSIRDKSAQFSTMAISLGTVTALLVLARVVFKRFFSTIMALTPDDQVIAITLVVRVAGIVISERGIARNGLGKDIWTVPLAELTASGAFFLVNQVLYFVQLSLIKLSLSLFFLAIFPGKPVRRLLLGTAIFNGVFGLTFVLATIFQCSPVSYFWTQYGGSTTGRCINTNALGWTNAAISITVDLWLICLPLSKIMKINLEWKQKLGVLAMFLIGTFVTVISILRLQFLITFANSSNPTYDQFNIIYWSTIELNVGMICTSLPSLRLLLVRLVPAFGSNTVHNSERSYDGDSYQLSSSRRTKEPRELSVLELDSVHPWQRISGDPGHPGPEDAR
ncbi:hypothetical protein PLIIFM63780_002253 [Purpureocillium lilacinum]|nr:hypothetical protein PLIIFM63780_002253 [Purpureocillium lilacinum]